MPNVMSTSDSRERAERVFYLRSVAGMSWKSIAAECGVTSHGGAQRAYERHVRRNPIPTGQAQLAEIMERQRFRNGMATKGIVRAVEVGDWQTAASLLRVQIASDSELAKLYGLHAAERVEVEVRPARELIASTRDQLLALIDGDTQPAIEGEVVQ